MLVLSLILRVSLFVSWHNLRNFGNFGKKSYGFKGNGKKMQILAMGLAYKEKICGILLGQKWSPNSTI